MTSLAQRLVRQLPGLRWEPGGHCPVAIDSAPKVALLVPAWLYLATVGITLVHESMHCLGAWALDALRWLGGAPLAAETCSITLHHPADWGGVHVAYADPYIPGDHWVWVPATVYVLAVLTWMVVDTRGD